MRRLTLGRKTSTISRQRGVDEAEMRPLVLVVAGERLPDREIARMQRQRVYRTHRGEDGEKRRHVQRGSNGEHGRVTEPMIEQVGGARCTQLR